jgi:Zn-dependent protease
MATAIFLIVLVGWIGSVMLHEYAHARVAYAGGDTSVVEKGYLSMNPLRYMHPVTSLLIPIIILAIGGIPLPGGAVYIDTSRLRSRNWSAAMSAAGPAANLLILVVASAPFYLGIYDPATSTVHSGWLSLALFCYLQIFSVIINLLPIPPLDGWGIIEPYCSFEVRQKAREFSNYGFMILLLIMFTDNPIRNGIYDLALWMVQAFEVPGHLVGAGFKEFKSVLG